MMMQMQQRFASLALVAAFAAAGLSSVLACAAFGVPDGAPMALAADQRARIW